MKKVVGLLLTFKEGNDFKAMLQIRGKFDYEKNCPELWPGICQLTVTGMLEKNEDFKNALLRETEEELQSEEISKYVEENIDQMFVLNDIKTKEKHTINYTMSAPKELIEKINWHKSSSGGKILSKKDLFTVVDKSNFNIDTGVSDQKNVTAMYKDQMDALFKAFDILAI